MSLQDINHQDRAVTKQLHIIHFSDLHFGNDHRFNVPATITGDKPTRKGYPSLLEKLKEDLLQPGDIDNLVICITGDFAHTADYQEFQAAEKLIKELGTSPIHGKIRGLRSIYVVPGNHDVNYAKHDIGERWERYVGFANRIFGTTVNESNPLELVRLDDRMDDLGAIFLTLNSSVYVEKDTPNEKRGEVDIEQLGRVEGLLEELSKKKKLTDAIRVALIHHHPVLIPALAEPGRGYDAVENSGALLKILRKYGFHLILHGHKHNPFVFTEDSQSAWTTSSQPIVIVAGGSVSSMSIPGEYRDRSNCYNRIIVKWHPFSKQTRISIVTRGLSVFDESGKEDLPQNWKWKVLTEFDRQFYSKECRPKVRVDQYEKLDDTIGTNLETTRIREYSRVRGNMAVVEVLPSLVPGQAYEARVWIVPHPNPHFQRELPVQVTWSAGPKHKATVISAEQDKQFCAAFHYWDAMLLQAHLKFRDGASESAFVYARLPEEYSQ